jgi:hypothetical protein
MPDYVHLIGAEDVGRAGYQIGQAADDMKRTADVMEETFRQHRLFMDDWLIRFEQALDTLLVPPKLGISQSFPKTTGTCCVDEEGDYFATLERGENGVPDEG